MVDRNGALIPSNEDAGGTATWYNLIEPYLALNNAASANWISLSCPSAVAGLAEAGVNSSTTTSSRATYGLNDAIKANGAFSRMVNLKKPSATVLLGDTHISNNKEWTTMGIQKSSAKAWHKEKCGVCYFDGHAELVDQSFIKSTKKADIFWSGVE
jgi:prepilin-type processing-associated H-X9-DG protein